MNTLAVSAPFHAGESFTSFCSRVAFANGATSSRTFAMHMGIPYSTIALGKRSAVEKLAEISGEDPALLLSGVAARDESEFYINGEVVTSRYFNRSRFRYCPACLDEDLSTGSGPVASRPFGRLAWHVSFIRTCHEHGTALAISDTSVGIAVRDDFSLIWRSLPPSERKVACPTMEPTDFERYVLGRLGGLRERNMWVDEMPLYVVGHLSETVGAAKVYGKWFNSNRLNEVDWTAAGNAGFKILASGEDSFAEFLKAQQDEFLDRKRNHYSGQALYGTLYRRLEGLMEDRNYDPIRGFIREHAIRTLPFGPDDLLFGKLGMPRQLHSIKTASHQSGLTVKLLRSRLLHTGIIKQENLNTTPHRIFIDAPIMDAMLEGMADAQPAGLQSTTVAEKEAGAILGVGRDTWRQIARAFDLRGKAYARVPRRRVEAFLEDLKQVADKSHASRDGLHDPATAAIACCCTVTDVLHLILSRKLKTVALDDERKGIAQVLVDRAEAWAAIHGAAVLGHVTSFEAADFLRIDVDSLIGLARAGTLTRTKVPGGGRQFVYLRKEIEDFNSTFASTSRIAAVAGMSSGAVAAVLREKGVEPSFGKTGRGAHIYMISALDRVFESHAIAKLRSMVAE